MKRRYAVLALTLVVLALAAPAMAQEHGAEAAGKNMWQFVGAAFAIGIDWAFKPLGPALGRLAQEGSTDEIEAAISASIDATVRWVYLLYATLVVVAFLGVTKLF